MYVWIWRRLPGGVAAKALGYLVLVVGALALLFFGVFPYAEPRLPFNRVTVDQDGGGAVLDAPAAPSSPSATP
ncbi:MAG: hypothetical protein ABR520_12785 [Mycobacteriales bacterium]